MLKNLKGVVITLKVTYDWKPSIWERCHKYGYNMEEYRKHHTVNKSNPKPNQLERPSNVTHVYRGKEMVWKKSIAETGHQRRFRRNTQPPSSLTIWLIILFQLWSSMWKLNTLPEIWEIWVTQDHSLWGIVNLICWNARALNRLIK